MQHLADETRKRCATCAIPYSCCEAGYCRDAIAYAKKEWGVTLKETGHPTLPLMGPKGCVAAPHLRPQCTIWVCPENRGEEWLSAVIPVIRLKGECGK